MRELYLIPLLFAFTACSSRIYMSSEHADVLKSGTPRSAIIAELGNPASTSVRFGRSGGRSARTDIYFTKARIPDRAKAMGTGGAAEMTLGLSDFLFAPYALIDHNLSQRKTLIIEYDPAAKLLNYAVRRPNRR